MSNGYKIGGWKIPGYIHGSQVHPKTPNAHANTPIEKIGPNKLKYQFTQGTMVSMTAGRIFNK